MGRANGEPAGVVGPDGDSYRRGRRGLLTLSATSVPGQCEVIHLTQPALLLARAVARQGAANYVVSLGNDGIWTLSLRDGHQLDRYEQREQAISAAARMLNADRLGGRILIHEVNGQMHEQVELPQVPIPGSFGLSLRDEQVLVSRPGGATLGELETGFAADRVVAALRRGMPVQARPVPGVPDDVPDMVGWLGKFKLYAAISFDS